MHEPGEYLGRHKEPTGQNKVCFKFCFKFCFCFFNWQQPSSLWPCGQKYHWLVNGCLYPLRLCACILSEYVIICQYLSAFTRYVHVSVSMCRYLVIICQYVSVFESLYICLSVCACILSVFVSMCLYLSSICMYLCVCIIYI